MNNKKISINVSGGNAKFDNLVQGDGNTFSKKNNEMFDDVPRIIQDFKTLREHLIKNGDRESIIAAGKISEAENKAEKKDIEGMKKALIGIGGWVVEVATKIGTNVGAAAIKEAAGI